MPFARVGHGNTPQDFFYSLPPITKAYLVAALASTALTSLGTINITSLLFIWDNIWKDFEIWRIITGFTYFGGFSFNFLIQLFLLVSYSSRYELSPFNTGGGGTSADYAVMLAFGMVVLMFIGVFFDFVILGPCLVFMIMYVWSRKEPQTPVSIFGFQFLAMNLPWVLLVFNILTGNSIIIPLIGIITGHLYFFIISVIPEVYRVQLLKTPLFVIQFFGGPQQQVPRNQQNFGGRHNWGEGRVLGRG